MSKKQTYITAFVFLLLLCAAFTFRFFMEDAIKHVEDNAPNVIISYDEPQYITRNVAENGTMSKTTEKEW